ncbi:MAG: MFS transporter [Candidatus Dormibacteraeota bacterium]|nr:MFS transporter [Candidatus Dormibacteraeota bacterium]
MRVPKELGQVGTAEERVGAPRLLLQTPRFSRLTAAILVSSVGDPMTLTLTLVIAWRSLGAIGIGLAYVCRVGATLAVGGLLGRAADRWDRRRLVVGLEALRCLALLLLPFAVPLSPLTIFPCLVVLGAAEAIVQSARQAAVPELVKDNQIETANSILLLALSTAQALGFALAGALLARWPQALWLFWLDAATFAVSGMLVATIPGLGGGIQLARLGSGLRVAFAVRPARALLIVAAIASVLIGSATPALLPLAYQFPGNGPSTYALLQIALIVGIVVGSLVAGRLASAWLRPAMALSFLIFATGCAALAGLGSMRVPGLPPALVAVGVTGMANALYAVANASSIMRAADSVNRGTLLTARFVIAQAALLVGVAVGAVAVTLAGPHWTFAATATGMALLGVTYIRMLRRSPPAGAQQTAAS